MHSQERLLCCAAVTCLLVSLLQVVGAVLGRGTALRHLNLATNCIGKHGARLLATGLANNTTLEVRGLATLCVRVGLAGGRGCTVCEGVAC